MLAPRNNVRKKLVYISSLSLPENGCRLTYTLSGCAIEIKKTWKGSIVSLYFCYVNLKTAVMLSDIQGCGIVVWVGIGALLQSCQCVGWE